MKKPHKLTDKPFLMWNYILHSFKCNVWISFSLARIKEKKKEKNYFWKTIKIRFVEVWEPHRNVLLSRVEVVITFSSCLAVQEDANKDFIKSNMPNKGILRNHQEEGEDPRSSTGSAKGMVAIRLLTPGCPSPAASIRLCPSCHQAPGMSLLWLLLLGCAPNPAGAVPLGQLLSHHCIPQLQQDGPPHHAEVLS